MFHFILTILRVILILMNLERIFKFFNEIIHNNFRYCSRIKLVMLNLECQSSNFLDSSIVSTTIWMWTILHLFTTFLNLLSNTFPFLRISFSFQSNQVFHSFWFRKKNSTAFFADWLQNIYNMLEIANMIDWKVQVDVSEMSWTINFVIVACCTSFRFLTYSLI